MTVSFLGIGVGGGGLPMQAATTYPTPTTKTICHSE